MNIHAIIMVGRLGALDCDIMRQAYRPHVIVNMTFAAILPSSIER
jgi:hypothetical protein